jgi:Cu(I)/Ag(I) efflux system membrane protein CusA/SilA
MVGRATRPTRLHKVCAANRSQVAEVASFGGSKNNTSSFGPFKMQYYNVSMMEVMKAVKTSNNDVGGRKFEMSNMSYIVRVLGYIKNIKDEDIAVKITIRYP